MGGLGVALGAFGAHGLKQILSPQLLETYKTGILYHLIHSVVLLALALNSRYNLSSPFYIIFAGTILFSFSLYIYVLSGTTFFAMITPIGGICLIVGWLSIVFSLLKNKT